MPHPTPISRIYFHALWLIPFALGALLTIGFYRFDWDHQIVDQIYSPSLGFFHEKDTWVTWIYHFAPLPGMLIAIPSLIAWIASIWLKPFQAQKRIFAFLALSMIIGPGLFVNAIFKDHYGRPRPRQTVEYGGNYLYHRVWIKGEHKDGRSFPSGHASVAFFMLCPAFLLIAYGKHRGAFLLLIPAALAWGLLVGWIRILAGGHWPSDVLWAALFVWLTSFLLASALGFLRVKPAQGNPAS